MENTIFPLAWYKLGSVESLLNLPITIINRMAMYMSDEEVQKRYRTVVGIPVK